MESPACPFCLSMRREFIREAWGIGEVYADLAEIPAGRAIDVIMAINTIEHIYRPGSGRDRPRAMEVPLAGSGYRTGKLTSRGVEFYPGWDPDLETLVEGNYVACTPTAAGSLPAAAWWKAG
jgi:hypothetical protein